jgi:hypothetical protein
VDRKWIGVGLALGLVFGVALHNIAVGIGVGLAAGALIGVARARREGR